MSQAVAIIIGAIIIAVAILAAPVIGVKEEVKNGPKIMWCKPLCPGGPYHSGGPTGPGGKETPACHIPLAPGEIQCGNCC